VRFTIRAVAGAPFRGLGRIGYLMVSMLLLSAGSLAAQTVEGTIDPSDPAMPVVTIVPPNCVSQGSFPVHYEVVPFFVSTPGNYTLSLSSTGAFASFYVYETAFDPTNGLANCIAADNSGAPRQVTVSLATDTAYFVVPFNDNFDQSLTLSYSLSFSGPAPVRRTLGDYDGDGKADLGVYRTATGGLFIGQSSTGNLLQLCCADPTGGDRPMPADYDGDGKTDVGIHRAATGEFFVARSSTGGLLRFCCADPGQGDQAIPADYDGDGQADLAVYRTATGGFFIGQSSTGSLLQLCCADPAQGDQPIPADYDGDGKADLAVYRTATGEFFVVQSSTGSPLRF
jgi:hypothetical protein